MNYNLLLKKRRIEIIFLILCSFQFFSMIRLGKYIYKTDLINISCIFVSIIVILEYKCKPIINRHYTGDFYPWIIATTVLWLVEVINSIIRYRSYGQGIVSVLSESFGLLAIIMVFPLCFLQKKENKPDSLKIILKIMSLIGAFISIIQVFLYKYGIVFLDTTDSLIRNDRIRFGVAPGLVSFGVIICFFDWLEKRKIVDLVSFFIELMFFVYATQTRSRVMYIIVAIYFTLILFLKNKRLRVLFLAIGILATAIIILTGLASDFAYSLSIDDGIIMRRKAILFYLKQWLSAPLFGMGYIKASKASDALLDIFMGPLYYGRIRYYYRTDVGIIGLLNETGIIGIAWYLWLIIILFKKVKKIYKSNPQKYTWIVAVYIFIIVCSISLIYSSSATITSLAVYIALIIHYETLTDEKNQRQKISDK